MIVITDFATEKLKQFRAESKASDKALRLAAVNGGCHGYEYQMGFDDGVDTDTKFEANGIPVVIDEQSLPMLKGMELDYTEDLQGSQFVFRNPNASSGCGCGKSFSC